MAKKSHKLSTAHNSTKNEPEELDIDKLPPLTRSALGIAKLPDDKTYEELKEEALLKKYGMSS